MDGTILPDGPEVPIAAKVLNMSLQEATSRTEVSLIADAVQEMEDSGPNAPRAPVTSERAGTAASP